MTFVGPTPLAQRGIEPAADARPGRIWLRITGYGAEGDQENWVAFGDDAAVAGGLVGRDAGRPVFCGDAIADPLTGLAGALAVVESHARGGGELIDVALSSVAATYAHCRNSGKPPRPRHRRRYGSAGAHQLSARITHASNS